MYYGKQKNKNWYIFILLTCNVEANQNEHLVIFNTPNHITLSQQDERQLVYLEVDNTSDSIQSFKLNILEELDAWSVTFPKVLSVPAKTKVQFPISLQINDFTTFKQGSYTAKIYRDNELIKIIPFKLANNQTALNP